MTDAPARQRPSTPLRGRAERRPWPELSDERGPRGGGVLGHGGSRGRGPQTGAARCLLAAPHASAADRRGGRGDGFRGTLFQLAAGAGTERSGSARAGSLSPRQLPARGPQRGVPSRTPGLAGPGPADLARLKQQPLQTRRAWASQARFRAFWDGVRGAEGRSFLGRW